MACEKHKKILPLGSRKEPFHSPRNNEILQFRTTVYEGGKKFPRSTKKDK